MGNKTHTVYRIICLTTGKSYIGQSIRPEIRRRTHFSDLKRQIHPNQHLQNAYNLYGVKAFLFGVIEQGIASEDISLREQYWIERFDSFNNGFNKSAGGDNYDCYGITCSWNGVEYPSYSSAAEACGISAPAMINRINRGYKCDQDLKSRPRWNMSVCVWNNKEYTSIADASRELGISAPSLYKYVRAGCRSDVDVAEQFRAYAYTTVWNGVEYPSVKAAANALGISDSTMHERLLKGYKCDADMRGNGKNHIKD